MAISLRDPIRFYTLLALAAWTTVVVSLFLWIADDNHDQALELARREALANISKDLVFRRWAASHGGVYVVPSERTPANPYLELPDRDVVTTGGKRLTLMNPAYVLREMQQQFQDNLGAKGHLTSLKLLNPANAPDPWERAALQSFEQGEQEQSAVDAIDGQPHLRVMRAVRAERDCLKCHAKQGYREGDVRGGISASVNLAPYLAHSQLELGQTLFSHGALLLLGYTGIGYFARRARRHEDEQRRHEQALLEERAQLRHQVDLQTRELRSALEEARGADRAKDEFIANMSHEMRTPLNAVVGLSYLAAQRGGDPRVRDYLLKISDAGAALQHIVNDLLDLSKIAADRMVLETVPFSLHKLLQRQEAACVDQAREKGLALSIERAADLPDQLLGDPLRLGQVLGNLLGNAIKFTQQGSVSLAVVEEKRGGSTATLRFSVSDSGMGMSEQELARIFQPFVQGDSSITRQFGGTGLGLAISKRLVNLMGGDISVRSEPGKGSCFSFTLSLARDTSPASDEEQTEYQAKVSFRDVRVLVADDQPLNQAIVKEMLEQVGIEVDLVDNGQLALERLSGLPAEHYDAVLMDIQMPVMDGIAATEALRRKPGLGALPVIALSAYTMAHERKRFFSAGMNDHIGKPFQAADLYATLARWVTPAKCRYDVATQKAQEADDAGFSQLRDIDGADGLMRFGGKLEHYLRWLRIFTEEAPKSVQDILAALQREDRDTAQKLLHGFKGRTGMLGMLQLHQATVALEAALRRGDASLDCDPWQAAYQRTYASLTSWLAQRPPKATVGTAATH